MHSSITSMAVGQRDRNMGKRVMRQSELMCVLPRLERLNGEEANALKDCGEREMSQELVFCQLWAGRSWRSSWILQRVRSGNRLAGH